MKTHSLPLLKKICLTILEVYNMLQHIYIVLYSDVTYKS